MVRRSPTSVNWTDRRDRPPVGLSASGSLRCGRARSKGTVMPRELVLGRPRRSRTPWVLAIGIALGVGLGFLGLATFRTGEAPSVEMDADEPAVGRGTTVTVRAEAGARGVARIRVWAVQGDRRVSVADETFEVAPAWKLWASVPSARQVTARVGSETVPGLQEGQLELVVEADGAGTWLFGAKSSRDAQTLPVQLRPPSLSEVSTATYVAQGGSEAVVYRVGPTATRHGVLVDERFFPGFPLGDTGLMFALFAVPYDRDTEAGIVLYAEDVVGNRVEMPFIDRFTARPMTRDTIRLSERTMKVLVERLMARLPELPDRQSLLANYIQINDDLRHRNDRQLEEIGEETVHRFTWSRPFLQMPAKVVSSFADRRTYVYRGKNVDRQDHLGFDLASVRRDSVPAANDGRVVFADYLGIYGNCVILDHGYGLMSLYAHLSSFSVQKGDQVPRGREVGRTGTTGLALGDHLHFSMLLRGLPVNPLEWWDAQWIENRIAAKLRPALTYESEP